LSVSYEAELPEKPPRAIPDAFVALVAPETGMERQARVGKARLAFLVAFACAALSGFAQASRVDARSSTLARLDKDNKLAEMSDKQVDDEVKSAERLFQVSHVAAGIVRAPVLLGLASLGVIGLAWFLKGKVKGRAVVPVAAATLLPSAIGDLLDAVSAFARQTIPADAVSLAPRNLSAALAALGHPLVGPALKLGGAFDFFSLWAAILMGYGVAAVGDVPKRRALIGTLVAWVCVRLLVAVAAGG
jgi:hypothetical protein